MTDELLEKFVPKATYADIAKLYRERFAGLARRITFPIPAYPEDDAAAAKAIADLKSG